jgi:hypothetical protein
MMRRAGKWVDLRGVLTAVVSAIAIAAIAAIASEATSLKPAVVVALAIAIFVGTAVALLERRTRRLVATLRFSSGPFKGHPRIDHLEGELALARARLILSETEERSGKQQDLEQVVGAALLAGFRVEHRVPQEPPWDREHLVFHPPLGSSVPGALTIGLAGPLTDSVDTAAQWLHAAGAPIGPVHED